MEPQSLSDGSPITFFLVGKANLTWSIQSRIFSAEGETLYRAINTDGNISLPTNDSISVVYTPEYRVILASNLVENKSIFWIPQGEQIILEASNPSAWIRVFRLERNFASFGAVEFILI